MGEGKKNGNRTFAEQREVGRVEGGWWLWPARCQRGEKKQQEPQGRRKGRWFLGDGPSGQQGWAQGGAGWRGEGLELGRMM